VASRFVAEAVRAKATVPVVVVPFSVSVPAVTADRSWLIQSCPGIEAGEFIFVCFFDVGSYAFRKNPRGAIEAFVRAFKTGEPVRLIVKVINGEQDPNLLGSLREQAIGQRITIWNASLEPIDRFRLLASADAFVSLHRSEGFGLVIAEAMALGRPVVVTDWSGNTDFTNSENAALVRYAPVRSEKAHGPYRAGTEWAEPDLDDAARQLRRVVEDDDWRGRIGAAAAKTIATMLSRKAVGTTMKSRLERLSGSTRAYRRMQVSSPPPAPPSPQQTLPVGVAIKAVSRDALRRPFFYALRAPRLPRLVASEGVDGLLIRLATQTRMQDGQAKRTFSLGGRVARLWSLLSGRRGRR
jgi:hypothetical protein